MASTFRLLRESGLEPLELARERASLLFDRTNWFIPQTITVFAISDLLAEGSRSINMLHSVTQGVSRVDGGASNKIRRARLPGPRCRTSEAFRVTQCV